MQISLEPPAAGLARVGRHGANGCYVWYKQVTQPVAGDFAIGIVMVYMEDGTSRLSCRSARLSGGVFMVNIVRGRPRCRSHDQVEITVWCQQHLVRVGGLSPAGLMCMSCSGRGQRIFVIVGLVNCWYFRVFLCNQCICWSNLCIWHQMSVAICGKCSALGFLMEHLGAHTGEFEWIHFGSSHRC